MKLKNEHPLLYFKFLNNKGKIEPLVFSNPTKLIVAWTVDKVIEGMQIVEEAVNNGFYAAGYVTYEAAPAFNSHFKVHQENTMPLLWFGIFNKPAMKSIETMENKKQYINQWENSVSIQEYNEHVNEILNYILQGKIEQVNYTTKMQTEFEGNSFNFFKQLSKAQDANYTAYLNLGDYTILSASPELFFQVENNKLMMKPMKGTVGRGLTYEEDLAKANWLNNSMKNKIENELIVDLLLEDIKKIAVKNTIQTPKLYEVEKYPTVYQMTSTITANVSPVTNFIDIFTALFPCGSITGVPKQEAMDIIKQLETTPREVYCGAIGYITPEKKAIFNVPIRTVAINNLNKVAHYGVGGAITKDSTKEEEYDEVLIKAKLLFEKQKEFKLLETIGLFSGEYFLLDDHLKRLEQSAAYFNFNIDLKKIKKKLMKVAKQHNKKEWIVRLLVNKNGSYTAQQQKITTTKNKQLVTLAKQPIKKENPFLYHKTTNREIYDVHYEENMYDVLLWNENKEVTEFTTGNIVVKLNRELYTPPIHTGLLGGTFRSYLLRNKKVKERVIKVNDLNKCDEIWFVNSVRKWVQVKISK